MSDKIHVPKTDQCDVPPTIERSMHGGYQPTASTSVDMTVLKPPRGGTAIDSQQTPSQADSGQK